MDFDFRHLTDARISDPASHDVIVGPAVEDGPGDLIRQSDRLVGTAYADLRTDATPLTADDFTD